MGKPYFSELIKLPETYEWALKQDVDLLRNGVLSNIDLPLLIIGSGGSYSSAHFISYLHETATGQISKPITPLEFAASTGIFGKAVVIISARGSNPDIIGALKHAIAEEAKTLIVVCFKKNSRLSEIAKKYRHVRLVEFELPTGHDGFLATNSLLAFNIFWLRAYESVLPQKPKIPSTLKKLVGAKVGAALEHNPISTAQEFWKAQNFVVLHGLTGASAAVDLESRFTEAALASTQISDLRNFAHGRHHWLAKQGESTSVIGLFSETDETLADRTIEQIPKHIPVVRIDTKYVGPLGNLALSIRVLYLTEKAGLAKGIDPGRPGVPPFGSRIYRLNAFRKKDLSDRSQRTSAIERKARKSIEKLRSDKTLKSWEQAYDDFFQRLRSVEFTSVIFDYDGTLCDHEHRFTGMEPAIVSYVRRLVAGGLTLGIATGRGKSVRNDVRSKIPKKYWKKIFLGYYNGGEIASADDESAPHTDRELIADLKFVARAIRSDRRLMSKTKLEFRPSQISAEAITAEGSSYAWHRLQEIVNLDKSRSCRILRSSHSFDIIPRSVSKRNLVEFLRRETGSPAVLCIGDKGLYPGNDYELLAETFALSVDEVSFDVSTCWNSTPSGYRGVQATEHYLRQLKYTKNGVKF